MSAEIRPVASEEENKKMVHAWAHQMRRELPKTHPAQETLGAVIRHNYVPSFPVRSLMPVVNRRDYSAAVIGLTTLSTALFVGGGYVGRGSLSWGIALILIGALVLNAAFSLFEKSEG